MSAFYVFLGGGFGSLARWLVGLGAVRLLGSEFPFGTLIVNILGCFAMGILARLIAPAEAGGQGARLLLMTGFLGGFTTFSAFALDAAGLWTGEAGWRAVLYGVATIAGSLGALVAGVWTAGALRGLA